MRIREKKYYPAYLILLLLLWIGAYRVDVKLSGVAPVRISGWEESSTLFRGEALKVLSMGYDTALADYFFMKMIQYFAYQSDNHLPMTNIIHFANAISELDPRFVYAYEFAWGALVNFDARPSDLKVKDAGEILRKGWRNNSDSWRIAQDLGFHNFFYEGNFEQAGNMYDAAFRLSKPPFPLYADLASRMRAEAGKPEIALVALQQQVNMTQDPNIRKTLEKQIQLVRTEIMARRLDERVEAFHKERGSFPNSLSDLITAGYIRKIPPDGMGGSFTWNAEQQEVESTSTPRLKAHFSNAYQPPWKKHGL